MSIVRDYLDSIGIDVSKETRQINSSKRVLVGMSGGVDSAVSALILKEQGFEVVAGFMRNWVELDEKGHCTSEKDYEDVISVCSSLDIPYYSFDFSKEYHEKVFTQFIEDYKNGHTPNPDVFCNKEVKFDCFYKLRAKLNFDYIATGHYCRTGGDKDSLLLKGLDPKKDQSYFLARIDGSVLENVLFPLGEILKTQVRELAQLANLPNKAKKDSTGVCFIGERDFKKFLQNYIDSTQGSFKTLDGSVVGQHSGSCFYTVGQRKGLGLGGPGDPWYVVKKEKETNTVFVERDHNHPAMFQSNVKIEKLHWIHELPRKRKLKAKVRYRQMDQECELNIKTEGSFVTFDEKQRAICPKQFVVFYDGDICLGSAMVKDAK